MVILVLILESINIDLGIISISRFHVQRIAKLIDISWLIFKTGIVENNTRCGFGAIRIDDNLVFDLLNHSNDSLQRFTTIPEIISDNSAGVERALEELPIPEEGGLSLAVRSVEALTVALTGLPASVRVNCPGGWAQVTQGEAANILTLRIEASPEARSFRIAY